MQKITNILNIAKIYYFLISNYFYFIKPTNCVLYLIYISLSAPPKLYTFSNPIALAFSTANSALNPFRQ